MRLNWPATALTLMAWLVAGGAPAQDAGTVYDGEPGEQPLWEFGIFGVGARLPHYRGSDEYKTYVLPLPYLVYRGDVLQSDREGVRGLFANTEHFETTFSLFGHPPVDSDNKAREGLEELDPLLELGPAVKWFMFGRKPHSRFFLTAAARAVISIDTDDFGLGYEGVHGGVHLIYHTRRAFGRENWSWGCNAGVDFGGSAYTGYFYDVPEEGVTETRSRYDARGGYGGCSLSANVGRRVSERLAVAVYGRWSSVAGAVFDDSPLVVQENNFVVGGAVIWTIARSKRLVSSK